MNNFLELLPRQIVEELDKYIIGQEKAKRAVAIALRNRVRRKKLPQDLIDEVSPKNIILIGPTGVGKTEIARRISKLSGAPFLKVEATKYTEVGYVGRDVESMVRDLMHVGVNMVKQELQDSVRNEAQERSVDVILDILLGDKKEQATGPGIMGFNIASIMQGSQNPPKTETEAGTPEPIEDEERKKKVRDRMREKLLAGDFEEREIEITTNTQGPSLEIFTGQGHDDIDLGGIANMLGGRGKKRKKMTVKEARPYILQEELDKLVDNDRTYDIARDRVQNMGIIFIDEIDKIASRSQSGGADVSREGVQRDILPIVEGCQVNTRYGLIDTKHILFIAAGAFHISKPSDLIPELQGRFPIRVELESLDAAAFKKILSQPANSLIRQYTELLATESVGLSFNDDALGLLADLAAEVNSRTENIGARRLHTMLELLLEELSFDADKYKGQKVVIDKDWVQKRIGPAVTNTDVSRYIL